jgi:hydroxyacylglutathione hydrolase
MVGPAQRNEGLERHDARAGAAVIAHERAARSVADPLAAAKLSSTTVKPASSTSPRATTEIRKAQEPPMKQVHVHAIPAFTDNYIWMMHDGSNAVVVDPGAAEPVEGALAELGLKLCAIVLTHLHYDHCWGVPGLLQGRSVPVYGPVLNEYDRTTHPPFPKPGTVPLDCVTHPVGAGDRVALRALNADLIAIAVPGHTRGHLAYWDQVRGRVFTGDSLFAGGCGKVFDSMSDMAQSLDRLAGLPDETEVYCGHEYTLENLRFAMAVDPNNAALLARYRTDQATRERGMPTSPSTIALEKATNPFLRALEPDIVAAIRAHTGLAVSTPSAAFEALRKWKDVF